MASRLAGSTPSPMPIQFPSLMPAADASRRAGAVRLLLAGVLLAAAVCAPHWARAQQRPPEAGLVTSAEGETMLLRDGALSTPIKVGESVRSGDILRTAVQARVQLRMVDGGLVAIEPRSEFQVASYRFEEQQQRSFLKLVRGAVRVVTGAIGKRDPADFRMTTPTATIGVRGTEFIARESDCQGAGCTAGERPGLTLAVLQGRVVVSNPVVGELEVPAGQSVYVAALGPAAPAAPSMPVAPTAPAAPSLSPPTVPAPPAGEAPRPRRSPNRNDGPELLNPPRGSRAAPPASLASAQPRNADETAARTNALRPRGRSQTLSATAVMPDGGMSPSDLFDEPESFAGRTHHPPRAH